MASGVITTLHNEDADRCVKIVKGSDGAFGFKEYRKDPEDAGRWTVVSDAQPAYATEAQALAAAHAGVAWLRDKAKPAEGSR
jgi:hypothetical protein